MNRAANCICVAFGDGYCVHVTRREPCLGIIRDICISHGKFESSKVKVTFSAVVGTYIISRHTNESPSSMIGIPVREINW